MKIRFDLDCATPMDWESAMAARPEVLLPPAFDALATVLAARPDGNFAGRAVSVAISLVDDAAIAAMNAQFRGRKGPTNVLSFPSPEASRDAIDDEGLKSEFLGDIAIARETVLREAVRHAKLPAHHFLHLALHGTLHLLGFDHEFAQDAHEMEETERASLALIGIADPYLLQVGEDQNALQRPDDLSRAIPHCHDSA